MSFSKLCLIALLLVSPFVTAQDADQNTEQDTEQNTPEKPDIELQGLDYCSWNDDNTPYCSDIFISGSMCKTFNETPTNCTEKQVKKRRKRQLK